MRSESRRRPDGMGFYPVLFIKERTTLIRNRKRYHLLLVIWLVFFIFSGAGTSSAGEPSLPSLSAAAAVLIDYQTGHLLYSHCAAKKLHPASTTKILTGILGLELGAANEIVSVSKYAAYTEGASLYLQSGEQYYLQDLIRGALINSGNDAAVAIAEHLGGNEVLFGRTMTSKARTLGAYRSRFYNPHGLTDPGHLTTAYDLALITRYALKNQVFKEIVKTRSGVIHELLNGTPVPLYNTNRLLFNKKLGVTGVKTGTTGAAGQCLVTAAEKNGRTLIVVVLGSDARYDDTLKLLDYGFRQCLWYEIAGRREPVLDVPIRDGRVSQVAVGPVEQLGFIINPRESISVEKRYIITSGLKAPLDQGTVVGRIEVFLGDQFLCGSDLATLAGVETKPPWYSRILGKK